MAARRSFAEGRRRDRERDHCGYPCGASHSDPSYKAIDLFGSEKRC
jgi:hypothetical protein